MEADQHWNFTANSAYKLIYFKKWNKVEQKWKVIRAYEGPES